MAIYNSEAAYWFSWRLQKITGCQDGFFIEIKINQYYNGIKILYKLYIIIFHRIGVTRESWFINVFF